MRGHGSFDVDAATPINTTRLHSLENKRKPDPALLTMETLPSFFFPSPPFLCRTHLSVSACHPAGLRVLNSMVTGHCGVIRTSPIQLFCSFFQTSLCISSSFSRSSSSCFLLSPSQRTCHNQLSVQSKKTASKVLTWKGRREAGQVSITADLSRFGQQARNRHGTQAKIWSWARSLFPYVVHFEEKVLAFRSPCHRHKTGKESPQCKRLWTRAVKHWRCNRSTDLALVHPGI